ncbi:hypothetical protein IAU59_006659 [Kwoniella sp. CBS 9459]
MQVFRPVARAASSVKATHSRLAFASALDNRCSASPASCCYCTQKIIAPPIPYGRSYSVRASRSAAAFDEKHEEDVDLFGDEPGSTSGREGDSSMAHDTLDVDDEPDAGPSHDSRPPSSPSSSSKYDLLDPRPKLPGSIKRLNRILSRQRKVEIPESDLDEKFVKGRGPGGQAINKTNSSVSLTHIPTGIRVQAQPTRSREENRKAARRILAERLEVLRTTGRLPGSEIIQGIEVQFPQYEHQDQDQHHQQVSADQQSSAQTERGPAQSSTAQPKEKGKGNKKAAQKEEEKSLSTAYTKAEIRAEKERRRKANRAKKAKKKYAKKDEGEDEGEGGSAEGEVQVEEAVIDSPKAVG